MRMIWPRLQLLLLRHLHEHAVERVEVANDALRAADVEHARAPATGSRRSRTRGRSCGRACSRPGEGRACRPRCRRDGSASSTGARAAAAAMRRRPSAAAAPGSGCAADCSSMRKPHVPQNRNDGGTSLPHDGQRRMPPAATGALGAGGKPAYDGNARRRTHRRRAIGGGAIGPAAHRTGRRADPTAASRACHPADAAMAGGASAAACAAHRAATGGRASDRSGAPPSGAPAIGAWPGSAIIVFIIPMSPPPGLGAPSAQLRIRGRTCSGPGSLCRNDCRRSWWSFGALRRFRREVAADPGRRSRRA